MDIGKTGEVVATSGVGREKKDDKTDTVVGTASCKKIGERANKGDVSVMSHILREVRVDSVEKSHPNVTKTVDNLFEKKKSTHGITKQHPFSLALDKIVTLW